MSVRWIESPGIGKVKVDFRNPKEHIHQWWKIHRFYEHSMLAYIRKRYSGGTFIDAGSNVGNHTLFFAAFCNVDRVISIEPVPYLMKWQKHNVALNDLTDKIAFYQCAVSNNEGYGSMENVAPEHHFNMGMNQLMEGEGAIPVTTIDKIMIGFPFDKVTLIKLDVEFYEIPALEGAIKLIESQRPALFIEAAYKHEWEKLKKFLGPLGYKPISHHNPTPTYEFVYHAA